VEADELAGYVVPAATDVLVSPYLLGRNETVWSDAQAFRPSRFSQSTPRMAHIPFAAGPRSCIGDHLALLELVCHAATMMRALRLYEEAPLAEVTLEARVNLRSRQDIWLSAEAL
jgi:cytochrome P450